MPWGRSTSTQVGRCNESVSASVPSRSKSRARCKFLAPVEEHVQGARDYEERPDVEQDKELPALPPLAQGARLVFGHPEQDGNRAQAPHPVEGEVAREVARGRVDRCPRERPGDEGRQGEGHDEQDPVDPAPPPPGEPVRDRTSQTTRAALHEHHVSSPRPNSGETILTRRRYCAWMSSAWMPVAVSLDGRTLPGALDRAPFRCPPRLAGTDPDDRHPHHRSQPGLCTQGERQIDRSRLPGRGRCTSREDERKDPGRPAPEGVPYMLVVGNKEEEAGCGQRTASYERRPGYDRSVRAHRPPARGGSDEERSIKVQRQGPIMTRVSPDSSSLQPWE